MIGADLIAALAVFAALSLALGAMGWAMDKLRLAARWRLWYCKTFEEGGDEMDDGRHRAECLRWMPRCLCNTCAYDDSQERPMCCTRHDVDELRCPMTRCAGYQKERARREATR